MPVSIIPMPRFQGNSRGFNFQPAAAGLDSIRQQRNQNAMLEQRQDQFEQGQDMRERQMEQQGEHRNQMLAMQKAKMAQGPQRPWYVQPDGSLHPAAAAYRAAGKSTTTVNMPSGQTDKFKETYDAKIAGHYAKLRIKGVETAGQARRQINSLNVMEAALNNPDLYSGKGGPLIHQMKKTAQIFGIPVKGVEAGEVVSNLSTTLALSEKDKLPGPLSNSDVILLKTLPPGLAKTPEGNRRIIQIGILQRRYKIATAQAANDYAKANNGRIDEGFNDYLSKVEDDYGQKFKAIISELKSQPQSALRPPTAGIPQLKSKAEFDSLPSGASFVAPDGTTRIKP